MTQDLSARRHRAIVTILVIAVLVLAHAWGPIVQGAPHWRVDLNAELGFSALGPAELTLSTAVRGDRGHLTLELVRSLEPSPRYRIGVNGKLDMDRWRIGTQLTWRHRGATSAEVELGVHHAWGDATLTVAPVPAPLVWTIKGGAAWDPLLVKLTGLTGDLTGELDLDGVAFEWVTAPRSTISGTFNPTQSEPLEIRIEAPLFQQIGFDGTLGLARGASRADWRWAQADIALERSPIHTEFHLTPGGWTSWSMRHTAKITEALQWGASTEFTPQGWAKNEARLSWAPGPGANWTAKLTRDPSDWRLGASGSWAPFDRPWSIDGEGTIGPGGLRDGRVSARATPGDLFLDGLFDYSGGFWLLDLSGSLAHGPWTLEGASSWMAVFGWDQGSLSLHRDLRF